MLYECHGHIILDGISYKEAVERHKNSMNEAFVRKNLKLCADSGVGFYRDGGDKHMVSALAKRLAPEYGVDYRTPVYIIHKKGCYGGMFGRAFADPSEYRELVYTAKRRGADFIKITVSGMLDFGSTGGITGNSLTLAELREMVKIANGEGFAVMAHANGAENIKNALEAGVNSIEHGFCIDIDALKTLAQTGAVWVPTCVTVANLIGRGRYNDSVLTQILDGHMDAIKKAAAIGVLVASGSDAGAAGVLQGKGTQDECELLQGLGVKYENGNRKIAAIF